MVNRFTLLGAGVLLGVGAFAFGYIRNVEAARANPEAVISLENVEAARAEAEALAQKPTPGKGTVVYACPHGQAFAVSYGAGGGRAELTIAGDTVMLESVFVADGVQFTDMHYTFRAQGDLGAVMLGDDPFLENCHVSHEAATMRAAEAGN